jgi:type I restriction enzyme R subunit
VELTHLRNEQQSSGQIALSAEEGEVTTIYSGTGKTTETEPESLSAIIDRINAQHGTDWTEADRLVFDAALNDLVSNEHVQTAAVNNTPENFEIIFPKMWQDALLGRMDRNEKVVYNLLDNQDLAADVIKMYVRLTQARAAVAYQEHCPIGELLGSKGENAHLEYKATLRTGDDTGELIKALETASLKTVAAFANSEDGGTLLIGIADDGSVHGLASDYDSLRKPGKDDRDVFQLHLSQILVNALGEAAASNVRVQLHTVDGADICRVHVPPSSFPVDAGVKIDKGGQIEKKTAFYVRIGNGTREIGDPDERQKYIAGRWSNIAAA